jgi:hypothetical protein
MDLLRGQDNFRRGILMHDRQADAGGNVQCSGLQKY